MSETLKKNAPKAATIAIAAVIANIIWGTPFKLIKVMNIEMGIVPDLLGSNYLGQVLATISLRFFIAGIMTLIFAKIIKKNILEVNKTQWKEVILMGLVSTTAAYFFFNIGNVNITSTINSTILAQSTIFFAAILAHFAYQNDKLSTSKILGLVIGFIGLIISQLNGGTHISDMFSFSITGEGFMLIYGLLAALATMLAKKNWVISKFFRNDRLEFNYWFSVSLYNRFFNGGTFISNKLDCYWYNSTNNTCCCICYSF